MKPVDSATATATATATAKAPTDGDGTPGMRRASLSRGLVLLMAVAGGAAVCNLYYTQPLLDVIARDLHIGQGTAGLLVTTTQVGYALGIMFIVPLGDIRNRRRLAPMMMMLRRCAWPPAPWLRAS